MSGLFAYYDPVGDLPPETAELMAKAMAGPTDRFTVILRDRSFALGCVSKGIYPGEGEVLRGRELDRTCLFAGRLLGFTGQEGVADPIATARKAFLSDATPACLGAINGPFAAAIWDNGRGVLEVITDRYGMYPIYMAQYRSAILFAAQMKALLAPGVLPVEFDPVAVALMLSVGELVEDRTLIRAVRVLPAGSKTTASARGPRTTRHWQYSLRSEETDFEDTANRLGHLLRNAVRRICSDSASVGVPLSGGLDSRVLLAAVPDGARVPSFTWGLPGCRDLRYAAAVARTVGSPHQGFEYEGGYLGRFAALGVWITEGQLPCTDFHVLPYVENVAERCNIILNGYAGDALLGGSFIKKPWLQADSREEAAAALWQWRDTTLRRPYRSGLLGPAMKESGFAEARAAFVDCYHRTPGRSPMDAAMAFLLDNRVRRRTSCGTQLMRWRVESDQPFFDNDFFDCVCRTPYSWRFRHRLYLRMLRACFDRAAQCRWQRTGLPASSPRWMMYLSLGVHRLDRYRPFRPIFRSRRVSDFEAWMRGPLRDYVTGLLDEPRTLDRGIYNPDILRMVVHDHMESGVDNSELLGSMIALELFARLFVDGDRELIDRCQVRAPPPHTLWLQPKT